MIQVHTDLLSLPNFKNAIITIGTFDGVHLGHQQIIGQLKSEAEAVNGETVIITFDPHPRIIVGGPSPVKILNTLPEKIALLNQKGIEHVVVIPFNEAFANQDAGAYVTNFLVEKFHPHTIIVGYDHRFGKNRLGDYHLLEDMGGIYDYKVKEIPEHVLNEVIISSTRIREALLKSDIETANQYLGYEYFFEGTVVEGNKLGRTLGYPTANLQINTNDKLVPGNGVYAVKVTLDNTNYSGMMNIGVRPTVDGINRMIEVNIFDFIKDIYGEVLQVTLLHHLRGEIKFNGLDALKNQLSQDKAAALKVLK